MAATNFTPIQLYFSTTASAVPGAANLAQGELAINITDGKLYYEDNLGAVQVIATKGAGTIGGSTTQIQYNNAGALAGNAAMVFNNSTNVTTLTTLNLTNALGAIYGGTAQSTYTQGDFLYASASNTLAKLGIGATNYILTSTGSIPQWVAPSSIAVLTATNLAGGLAGSVPYQSALDTTTFLAIGAANRVMTSTGTAPQWVTALTGLTGVSSSSITDTGLTSGRVTIASTSGLLADSANLTFNGTTLTTTGLSNSGFSTLVKTLTFGDTSFNGTAVFAAATPAKLYMGTGTVTDVTSAISATNAIGAIASLGITPIAATNTSVTYTNAATLYIAGAPSAGTNITITNPYSLYVAAGASYLASLTLGAALPVANGGTGLTAGTSGGVLAYTATGTLASSTALAASALVIGGGAGAAPSTTTTGTGVVTALGVNTGTAGAFVVNGGALGTPSSGTATNLTGLPVSTGISGLGSGVATFLATPSSANLLAAVTDETGTGALVFATSPTLVTPALGTPASGTVTNLTGTASININGTVGATTAAAGAFTTLSATGVTTLQAGTNLLPALTTTGDTNTGIFFPAADKLGFTAGGGTDQMALTSTGLGIGTSSPATGPSGAIANVKLALLNGVPSQNNGTSVLLIGGDGNHYSSITAEHTSGGNTYLAFGTSTGAVNPTEKARISSDGTFRVKGAGTAGSTDAFQVAGGAPADAMVLNSSGNVGIGTSSPSQKLEVNVNGGNSATAYILAAAGGSNTANQAYGIAFDTPSSASIFQTYDGNGTRREDIRYAANAHLFGTAGFAAERMRIDSSGNLRLINSNNIASITQTAITLTGSGGSGTGGQTVNIITANSTARGVLIVGSTQSCSAIFFINSTSAVNLSSQTTNDTRFTATSGAANTANVFVSGANIVLENNIQASRDFFVTFIGQI